MDQVNRNLVECDIKVIGDKQTICQVVKLLSYMRNLLKNKQKKDILLKVGSKSTADFFSFSVNDQEIKDYIAQDIIEIN